MTGALKMYVDGFEFKISATFDFLSGHVGYVAYQGNDYEMVRPKTYPRDNPHFFGRKGFDESRALNYIANDYVEFLKNNKE